jgi:CubicO group peptidase (beta-lactamase class C family)
MQSLARRICCIIVLLYAAVFYGQTEDVQLKQLLDPLIEKGLQTDPTPGLAFGIVHNGRLVYARGFGVMTLGHPEKSVTPGTLFHMASVTKPFVATCVMQLWEQGKVDLDAPVMKYVSYFRLNDPRYRSITVRQMLTHSSGMPDVEDYEWNKPQYDDGALERYVRSLSKQKLLWDPGTKMAYSNMAYEVLGDLIAKVSGMSFEDYVDVHILKPLGMNSSTLLLKKPIRQNLPQVTPGPETATTQAFIPSQHILTIAPIHLVPICIRTSWTWPAGPWRT